MKPVVKLAKKNNKKIGGRGVLRLSNVCKNDNNTNRHPNKVDVHTACTRTNGLVVLHLRSVRDITQYTRRNLNKEAVQNMAINKKTNKTKYYYLKLLNEQDIPHIFVRNTIKNNEDQIITQLQIILNLPRFTSSDDETYINVEKLLIGENGREERIQRYNIQQRAKQKAKEEAQKKEYEKRERLENIRHKDRKIRQNVRLKAIEEEAEKKKERDKNEVNNIIKNLPLNIDRNVRSHLKRLYETSKQIKFKNRGNNNVILYPHIINEIIKKQSSFNSRYHGSCGKDQKCQEEKAKAYQYLGCTIHKSGNIGKSTGTFSNPNLEKHYGEQIKSKVKNIKNKARNHALKAGITTYNEDCNIFNGSIAPADGGKKTIKKKSTTKKPVKKTTTKKPVKKTTTKKPVKKTVKKTKK